MKKPDHLYLNGWWHLLPNICLLIATMGQFHPMVLPAMTKNFISESWITTATTSLNQPLISTVILPN
jgi:hypothetical protein